GRDVDATPTGRVMLVSMPKDAPDRKGLGMSAGGARRVPRQDEIRVRTPRQIYDHLDRYVIGQEGAKRAVATAAHQHLKRIEQRRSGAKSLLRKTNLLLMGPTGSGKTHIARNLAELLEVPFTVVDATEYTEAGYYGKDVEVMVAELLFKSGHSIDATERGIIFIDEIDKIARRGGSSRTGAASRMRVKELVEYGMLAELLGRIPVQVQLSELSTSELYEVLTAPPDSLVKEYREALKLDGVDLDLKDDALRSVVQYAVDKRLGA